MPAGTRAQYSDWPRGDCLFCKHSRQKGIDSQSSAEIGNRRLCLCERANHTGAALWYESSASTHFAGSYTLGHNDWRAGGPDGMDPLLGDDHNFQRSFLCAVTHDRLSRGVP